MINIIAAIGIDNVIGKSNKLLWHIKPDLKYFNKITKNNIVIMGRKTFLSLPNGALPERINIVITRNKSFKADNTYVVNSIEDSIKLAKEIDSEKEIYICGGENIYRQFMSLADKLFITHVFSRFEADTYFPEISEEIWEIDSVKANIENINHKYPHIFTIYKKKSLS